ncbi:MAG: hypothetical protein ACR2I2_08900 [Bryobacteraceae bacterium]
MTEYGSLAPETSAPLATCCPVVESVTAGPHAPAVPPVTLPHVTVTADVGTVAQLVNDVAAACTCKVQVLLLAPLDVVQLTVAAELPGTLPRLGSVAVKLIVLGLAEMAPSDV